MPRSARRFRRLQAELSANDLDREYLSRQLGHRGRAYVDRRMSGMLPWDMTDMYKLMELVRWPVERMYELFPRNGIEIKKEERKS